MPKIKRVRKRRPDRWRFGENENWFSHMSEQGLHLNELNREFAYFAKGEPEQYRYRIDYSDYTAERREFYQENGWDYVANDEDISVYRSLNSDNAPELHTDPIETSYALRKLKNKTIWGAIGVVVTVLLVFLFYNAIHRNFPGQIAFFSMRYFVDMFGFVSLVQLLVMINMAYLSVRYAVTTTLLYVALREGREIDHNADWSPALKRKNRRTAFLSTAQFSIVAILLYTLIHSSTVVLPVSKEDIVYKNHIIGSIRLADIDNDAGLLRREVISSMSGKDDGNSIEYRWTPLTAFYILVTENGVVPDRQWAEEKYVERGKDTITAYEPSLSYTIYKPRFRFVTDALFHDLVTQKETWSSKTNSTISEAFDYPEFERLFIQTYHDNQDKTQLPQIGILAMTPDYIIDLRYRGEESLTTVLEAITDSLK